MTPLHWCRKYGRNDGRYTLREQLIVSRLGGRHAYMMFLRLGFSLKTISRNNLPEVPSCAKPLEFTKDNLPPLGA
jgi:hypothetical protein